MKPSSRLRRLPDVDIASETETMVHGEMNKVPVRAPHPEVGGLEKPNAGIYRPRHPLTALTAVTSFLENLGTFLSAGSFAPINFNRR